MSRIHYRVLLFFLLSCIIVAGVSLWKPHGERYNYLNSDATFHTLLTMTCYDETPASEHHYVPLVSLGGDENKGYSWGATIPDENGNYYYTSFSPAGFVAPYAFVKLLGLPINENSLFLFNTALSAISAWIIMLLLYRLFYHSPRRIALAIAGGVFYLMQPEIMHGMGAVYWHQSLMQVLLPMQLLAFLERKHLRYASAIFYIVSFILPYVEWTGYVANGGYCLYLLHCACRKTQACKGELLAVFGIVTLTLCSFILFCLHYLSVVDAADFFEALKARFFSRNVATNTSPVIFYELALGYLRSFVFTWLALVIVLILLPLKDCWAAAKRCAGVLFLMAFPLLENLLMNEHAFEYSYDRMKVALPLLLLLLLLIDTYCASSIDRWRRMCVCATMLCLCCLGNVFFFFSKKSAYHWLASFRQDNLILAEYLKSITKNGNGIYTYSSPVRGYMNLLFQHSIQEMVADEHEITRLGGG